MALWGGTHINSEETYRKDITMKKQA